MADLVWKDPPPDQRARGGNRGRGRWVKVAEQLKVHPGQWAYLGVVKHVSSGTYLKKKFGLEVTTRIRDDERLDIYARWPEVES